MGAGEFLKGIYYSGEEKWYNFWDKVDSVVPVYKLIDPIDSVIPTFALFLIIIFLLLVGAGAILLGGFSPLNATLQLSIVDSTGASVSGATISFEGIDQQFTSNDFGLVDTVQAPFNSTLSVTVTKGDQTTTVPVTLDEFSKKYTITLPAPQISFAQKSIRFQNSDGSLATGQITLHYTCSQNAASAPADDTIYSGTANVAQSTDCGTLSVSISSPKYDTATFTLSGPSGSFTLTPSGPTETVNVTVNLKLNGAFITQNIAVQAYQTSNVFLPVDTKTTTNGQATFTLPEGDYKFKVQMQQGYRSEESAVVTLSKSAGAKSVDIAMEQNILGEISIRTMYGTSALSGVHVVLNKVNGDALTEVIAQDTNDTGYSIFDVAEDANYVAIATKDDYCDASANVSIGDERAFSMKRFDGSCGNRLTARVIDQDGKPVAYAKAAIFAQTSEDSYKLSYAEKLTDFNGYVSWNPVQNSDSGEKYKVFAFKAVYSGWSDPAEFNSTTALTNYTVQLTVPVGTVHVTVKDTDGAPVQFAEVQLFDEYSGDNVSGKRVIEAQDGTIDFAIKADKKVYAVVTMDGYESYTSLPIQVLGSGNTNIEVELSRPPVGQLRITPLGLFKNGQTVLQVEAGQEYDALFEVTAPKSYDELGFFVRLGKDDMTKTELDQLFIKDGSNGGVMASGKKTILTGSTYTPPKGYNTDSQYENLEESKWAQVTWVKDGYVPGKIIVGVKVKIRDTAQSGERLELWSRAWGKINGVYERDLADNELGTSENSGTKQALYAAAKPEYISVGTETLCDSPSADKSFCITATYTDPENFTQSFTDSFDAKNNSTYDVSIRVVNNSTIGFDNAKIMIENPEENMLFGDYSIVSPKFVPTTGTLNAYKTDWIDASGFVPNSPIDIVSLKVTPQKTGTGTIHLRLRDNANLIYEKDFTVNISSDKKMTVQYMAGSTFGDTMPTLVSGKLQNLTVKAINSSNNLEIENALVKLYDRFGTLLLTQTTNKLGVATLQIPASFPGEKLRIQVEMPEYETFVADFTIAQDVVTVDPDTLSFTVNPQNNITDKKTVKITNMTGFDLVVKEIKLTGKLKGLLNESQISAWFETMKGKVIKSQDYEELTFEVVSSAVVPSADDLDAQFEITLGAEGKEWVKDIDTKIRVGLGKDVDLASCLEVTKNQWSATTRGQEVETSFEIKNNCTVDKKPVPLKNLGAIINSTAQVTGTFNAASTTVQVELGSAYARIFRTTLAAGEKIPVTIKFTPMAGTSGVADGSIVFSAQNPTDSKSQEVTAEMKYTVNYENLQDCLVVGADQVVVQEGSTGSFSVVNNCKSKTDILIDPADLQGAITNKTFSLNSGESKDVQVTANIGQVPGAYNVLVSGRQLGTQLELAKNIRVIIDPTTSCFKLSRYAYDVYDSPVNNFDGVDRGYLRNECIQKTTTAKITGVIPADTGAIMKMMLWGALVGGAAGYFKNDKLIPDSMKGWFDSSNKNLTTNIQEAYDKAANAASTRATNLKSEMDKKWALVNSDRDKRMADLRKQADDLNKSVIEDLAKANTACASLADQKAQDECKAKAKKLADDDQKKIQDELNRIDADFNATIASFKETYDKAGETTKLADAAVKKDLQASKAQQNSYAIAGTTDQTKIAKVVSNDDLKAAQKLSEQVGPELDNWNTTAAKYKKQMDSDDHKTLKVDLNPMPSTAAPGITPTPAPVAKPADNNTLTDDELDQLWAEYYTMPQQVDNQTPITTILKSSTPDIGPGIPVAPETPVTSTLVPENSSSSNPGPGIPVAPDTPVTSVNIPDNTSTANPGPGIPVAPDTPVTSTVIPDTTTSASNSSGTSTLPTAGQAATKLTYAGQYKGAFNIGNYKAGDSFIVDQTGTGGYYYNWKYDPQQDNWIVTSSDGISVRSPLNKFLDVKTGTVGQFILATTAGCSGNACPATATTSGTTTAATTTTANKGFSPFSVSGANDYPNVGATQNNSGTLMNALLGTAAPLGIGMQMGSGLGGAVAGALTNGLLSWMQAQDTAVNMSESFVVPMVIYQSAKLDSPEGIGLTVGQPTYDYDNFNGLSFTGATSGTSTSTATTGATTTSTAATSTNGGALVNTQALSATIGQVEIRELEFANAGKAVQSDARKPFVGMLTVTGTENMYQTDYKYDTILANATKRGDYKTNTGNFLTSFFAPSSDKKALAQMAPADLVIAQKRNYEKKFHLLFDSWEYISCGPKTYPCAPTQVSNCDVDGKKGVTGTEGVPKILLKWGWDSIKINECDSDSNPNYNYCDTTQLTTSTLEKLLKLEEFFKSNPLPNCPTINDIGSKTQKLSETSQDVGITSLQIKSTANGATIDAVVETNNNLPMGATVKFKLTRANGDEVKYNNQPICPDLTQQFTSSSDFTCNIDSNKAGVGTFNLVVTMSPTLCTGCGNYDTSNDTVTTGFVLGTSGAAQCQEFSTNKDYLEKVLMANNIPTDKINEILGYVSFKANLERDGFTNDFKTDYDSFVNQLAGAPPSYKSEGIRDLFLSPKFNVTWPTQGNAPWEAGKYDATIVVKFKNNSWHWDNNNIESVTLDLEPQGDPEPNFTIYNVAFDGPVGLNSDDGRQGYGAKYEQQKEDAFVITKDSYSNIVAQPKSQSNAATIVNMSVINGTAAFDLLNSSPTKGNVLSIYRTGDSVDFTITPSVPVPLILNVTRNNGVDAFGFYSAEVNGQPQETGSSFISWTGIGQGCVTFDGSPMKSYYNTPDYKASGVMNGYDGYGLFWPMAKVSGTASFYGQFFAPQDASTILKMTGQMDSANFESTYGDGTTIAISPSGGINTLSDVLDLVKAGKVCVIGGDYYWNNLGITTDLVDKINAKENTCISSS